MQKAFMKSFYFSSGALALIASLLLLWFFVSFTLETLRADLYVKTHPFNILAILGVTVFAGIFLFNSAVKIIIQAGK